MRRCVQTLDRTCTLGKCTDMKQGDLNLKGSKISTGFALQPTMAQSNWFQCLSAGGSWQSETGEKPGWQLCLREDCSVTPLARQRHGLNKRNSCVSVWSRVLIAAWQPLPHVHVVFKCHMHGAYPSCCVNQLLANVTVKHRQRLLVRVGGDRSWESSHSLINQAVINPPPQAVICLKKMPSLTFNTIPCKHRHAHRKDARWCFACAAPTPNQPELKDISGVKH